MYPLHPSEVTSALENKGATKPCPRCNSLSFNLVGESEISVRSNGEGLLNIDRKHIIPTVVVVCENCGFISHHAKASLGFQTGGLLR
jgi:predicted nucleic-acid-binding Zn-ribbon protein